MQDHNGYVTLDGDFADRPSTRAPQAVDREKSWPVKAQRLWPPPRIKAARLRADQREGNKPHRNSCNPVVSSFPAASPISKSPLPTRVYDVSGNLITSIDDKDIREAEWHAKHTKILTGTHARTCTFSPAFAAG
jgi:hypothetical protein